MDKLKRTMILSTQLMVMLCFLALSFSLSQAEVTLTVGDGLGLPGSSDNQVEVSLENQNDKVKGIQADVCDVDDYLTCTGCETTERTSDFSCSTNELGTESNDGCCSVLLVSYSGGLIEEGTGPIFTITYDVSGEAPAGECRDLNPEEVKVSGENKQQLDVTSEPGEFCFPCTINQDCDDGIYCNGEDSCSDGLCVHSGDPCLSGTQCNEETDSCDLITTTTTTVPTTTTTPTTTSIPSSYRVSISPSSATLDSGAILQFMAKTTYGGVEVDGNYTWSVESSIGSIIDENGLFTAGDNTTESEIEETVKVTDSDHQNKSATATVTIKVKEEPPPECEVTINPSSATLSSGDSLTLSADTIGEECEPGVYEWSIDTEIESLIDQEGNYTAGINDTGSQVTDIITVVDQANADISNSAIIKVESEVTGEIVNLFPKRLLGSRWIPLPYFLLIIGEDTNFNLSSTISFESEDIFPLARLGFGNILLTLVLLKANPQEGTVTITVNTGEENVTGEITIELLPFPFTEDDSSITESYREISLDTSI